MTANGIRLAAAVQDIPVPEPQRTPIWSLTTPQEQMGGSIPLARRTEPSEETQASVGAATTVGAVASAGVADGVVGDGALASADRTGDSPGILGGMARTGMAMVLMGMVRDRTVTTIRITATIGPTIRRRTGRIRHQKMTRKETITARRARRQTINTSAPTRARA
jgi:hypothetical protein